MKKRKINKMTDVDKPVLEHLAELRIRLIIIFFSLLITTIAIYIKSPLLIKILKKPINNFKIQLIFFTMTGAFTTRLKLSVITSIIILSPLIYYQIMAFIGPGLKAGERKLVYKSIFFITPMFITGTVFGYVFIVPKALNFLISYGSVYMDPMLSGEKYLIFIALLCVLIGVIFVIPVILVFLGKLGILNSILLKKIRKFVIFTVLIGEGIIVSDFLSFLLIGIPFIIIYEISLWIVILIEKRSKNACTDNTSKKSCSEQY